MNTYAKEIVIRPTEGFSAIDLREVWAYRDLLWLLVWRDISVRYKQTVLGPLWFVIQPVLTTLVFTLVFGKVAQIPTAGVPPLLFYLCGLLAWNYFSQTFQSTSTTLVSNAGLFGKVYFPRLIVPLSGVLSNLAAFGIQFITFAGFFAAFKFTASADSFGLKPSFVLFPLALVQLAALSLGIGLWFAALTAKFRDFAVLAGFLVQLWMYATPVIYPLSRIPERWQPLVALNPMTMPVECFRHMLLGAGTPTAPLLALSVCMTLLTLISGVLMFKRVERTFVDIV